MPNPNYYPDYGDSFRDQIDPAVEPGPEPVYSDDPVEPIDGVAENHFNEIPEGEVANAASEQLRAFVERVERLEEEKAALQADIKEVYSEAKACGFDVKMLKKVVSLRTEDATELREQEAILHTYMRALGMRPVDVTP